MILDGWDRDLYLRGLNVDFGCQGLAVGDYVLGLGGLDLGLGGQNLGPRDKNMN